MLRTLLHTATLLMAIAAAVFGWQRFHRSDEQVELRRYVADEVPTLLEREQRIHRLFDRLLSIPGPPPNEARRLLVDELIPLAIDLRRQAAEVEARSPAVHLAKQDYLAYLDRLIGTARAAVRTIDDPKTSTAAGASDLRAHLDEARRSLARWRAHLKEACVRLRLTPPSLW